MAKPIVSNDEYPLWINLGMQSQQALENGDTEQARELAANSHVELRKDSAAREQRRLSLLDDMTDERERRTRKFKPMHTRENERDGDYER